MQIADTPPYRWSVAYLEWNEPKRNVLLDNAICPLRFIASGALST